MPRKKKAAAAPPREESTPGNAEDYLARMVHKLGSVRKDLAEQSAAKRELEETVARLRRELDASRSNATSLESALEAEAKESERLRSELERRRVQRRAEADIDNAFSVFNSKHVRNLQDDVQKRSVKYRSLKDRARRLIALVEAKDNELEMARAAHARERESLQQRLGAVGAEREEMERRHEAEVYELQQQVLNQALQVRKLKSALKAVRNDRDHLRESQQHHQQQRDSLLADADAQAEADEVAAMADAVEVSMRLDDEEDAAAAAAAAASESKMAERWSMPAGVPPAAWVADDDVDACAVCTAAFNLLRRKHHCRSCGAVVCDSCSPLRARLPSSGSPGPVRVCTGCRQHLVMSGVSVRPAGGR